MDSHPETSTSVTQLAAAAVDAQAQGQVRFPINDRMRTRLERDYKYHPPSPDQQERYVAIRETAKELATLLVKCVPESRELHAALTSLETAVMQANSGIARNK